MTSGINRASSPRAAAQPDQHRWDDCAGYHEPVFHSRGRGAEDIAYQNSDHLMLCNTDNVSAKEVAYWQELRKYRPAGSILIPSVDSQLARVQDAAAARWCAWTDCRRDGKATALPRTTSTAEACRTSG